MEMPALASFGSKKVHNEAGFTDQEHVHVGRNCPYVRIYSRILTGRPSEHAPDVDGEREGEA